MIEADQLTKYYGSKLAVKAVSFFVGSGEVVGLLGPNGAGKTTIMRILTGFLPPSAGIARVAGFDVMQQPLEVKKRIGYLPETPPLYPEMRVREFLSFAADLKLVPRHKRRQAVAKAMARCGLEEMADRRIEHLSKGYRQRVGLAQAIVHEPLVAILDEPTAGLDPQQVREVRSLVGELAESTTLLVSSHILSEVEATCGRVIIINEGELVAIDSPASLRGKLYRGTEQVVWVQFRGPVDAIIERMQELEAVSRVQVAERGDRSGAPEATCKVGCDGSEDSRNQIARCVLDAGGGLLELREEQMSLEQVFIRLTQQESHETDVADM